MKPNQALLSQVPQMTQSSPSRAKQELAGALMGSELDRKRKAKKAQVGKERDYRRMLGRVQQLTQLPERESMRKKM